MANKPFAISIDNRAEIIPAKRKTGFQATQEPHEYANQAIFESVTDHVWGTQNQTLTDDATFYIDGSGNVLDKNDDTVILNDYDRVLVAVDTLSGNRTFPAGKIIEFVPSDVADLDSNTLTLPGTYLGELRADNGTVDITGTSYGLAINGTATVDISSMTAGMVIVNGTPAEITEVDSVKDQEGGAANGLKMSIFPIGIWNMVGDAAPPSSINHSLDKTKVRTILVSITSDSVGDIGPGGNAASGTPSGISCLLASTEIFISRIAGSFYDSASYNDTATNRGYITVWYEA